MHISNRVKSAITGLMLCGSLSLAHAEVVVVVSAKSGIGSMSADQVSQIFLGKSTTFPNGGTAVPIDQSLGAVARDEFYTKVTGKDASQIKAYWAKRIVTGTWIAIKAVTNDAAVKSELANTPGAIAYIEKSSVDSSVKVVLAP